MNVQVNRNGGWASRVAEMMGLKPNQAHLVKYLAIALALGVLFLNAGQLFGIGQTGTKPERATEVAAARTGDDELSRMEREMEANLEVILSMVDGAGQVKVQVNLQAGPSAVPQANTREQKTTTEEKAVDGSGRSTTTTQVDKSSVITKDGTRDDLALIKHTRAQVAGVLVVAPGATNPAVRVRLHEAAMTALGVSAHRISVVPARGR